MPTLRSELQAKMQRSGQTPEGLWHRFTSSVQDMSMSTACESPLCVAGAVFLLSALVMMVIRPPFILRRDPGTGAESLNLFRVLTLGLIAAAVVPLVYYLV